MLSKAPISDGAEMLKPIFFSILSVISNTDSNDTLKIQNRREFQIYIQCFACHAQENT